MEDCFLTPSIADEFNLIPAACTCFMLHAHLYFCGSLFLWNYHTSTSQERFMLRSDCITYTVGIVEEVLLKKLLEISVLWFVALLIHIFQSSCLFLVTCFPYLVTRQISLSNENVVRPMYHENLSVKSIGLGCSFRDELNNQMV